MATIRGYHYLYIIVVKHAQFTSTGLNCTQTDSVYNIIKLITNNTNNISYIM